MNTNLDAENENLSSTEKEFERVLRPLSFDDFTGQVQVLENLKVFTTSSPKVGADMKTTVNGYLLSNPLVELMRMNNEGKNVKIYIKTGANEKIVNELLMFVEGANLKDANTILLSITGNFSLDEIAVLTEKMNLPGGEDLKKASKK